VNTGYLSRRYIKSWLLDIQEFYGRSNFFIVSSIVLSTALLWFFGRIGIVPNQLSVKDFTCISLYLFGVMIIADAINFASTDTED
jgi:hypothetical protein